MHGWGPTGHTHKQDDWEIVIQSEPVPELVLGGQLLAEGRPNWQTMHSNLHTHKPALLQWHTHWS